MLINTKTGAIAIGYVARDAEMRYVGGNSTPNLRFSLKASGKGDDAVWVNCVAWRELAEAFSILIHRGVTVKVYGHWETSEYNEKTYTNLVAEYIDVFDPDDLAEKPTLNSVSDSADYSIDEEDLPF